MAQEGGSPEFQCNDPVFVRNDADPQLEGVILYIGAVPELEPAPIYIGVRLTGTSVGSGTNDGSISSSSGAAVRYFDCPPGCGLFVTPDRVTKRNLTKLEALRLRRELASSSAPVAATTAVVPSGRITPPRDSVVSTSTGGGTVAKSRLEELRLRREALKSSSTAATEAPAKEASPMPVSTAKKVLSPVPQSSSSATKVSASLESEEWKMRLETMQRQLDSHKEEHETLQKEFKSLKSECSSYKMRAEELQQRLDQAAASKAMATTTSPSDDVDRQDMDDLQQQKDQLESELATIKDQFAEARDEALQLRKELAEAAAAREAALVETTRARAEVTSYQNQLRALTDQTTQRGASDAIHYKERAKLSADVSALKRKVEQLEQEKTDLEASVEDLTLDKEQLQEEKEALEEKYEDLKLDAETAQMEVEELRMELEDVKASAGRAMGVADSLTVAAMASAGSPSKATSAGTPSEDMIQSLQTQNARLREALIRLREQSGVEKMELTRQLRAAEKVAETSSASQSRLEELTALNRNLDEQVNALKDMVEQSAAFEMMVEDLSDRVMLLEEQNVSLNTVIRELEEAADLTAEMEEVQADELKAMSRDLEGRDTLIRNLEEAIKMQKRREDDFRRTVANYKKTVDTLRQEKQALLELQQGGEGEKSDLVASSQKALSRAANLVAEAASLRKREAEAVATQVECISFKHLSHRLENLLPHEVFSSELAAIKGEIVASKVVCKASQALSGIVASFRKNIRPPLTDTSIRSPDFSIEEKLDLHLSDDLRQEIQAIMYQTNFALAISEVSSELIRFIAAGQWPDLLTTEVSMELGAIVGHSVPDLDHTLGAALKTLKEEGSLTMEQSNLGAVQLSIQRAMESLRSEITNIDKALLEWRPPGWEVFRDITKIKTACLGMTAAFSVFEESNVAIKQDSMIALHCMIDQCSSLASNTDLQLYSLDVTDENLVGFLSATCNDLLGETSKLIVSVEDLFISGGSLKECFEGATNTLQYIGKLAQELRSRSLSLNEREAYHPLSPEADDPWRDITNLVRSVRSIDGDSEDVNYVVRAKAIEVRLGDAVENEPKLASAIAKVASLEKSLSSRSKEVAIQNARLSELEKIIAKSSATPVGRGGFDFRTSDEYNSLQEENRVLTEAMEVLQREVEMYENEIRSLKDFKSPKRGNVTGRSTPVRSNIGSGVSLNPRGADETHSTLTLEATLFRPALQQALQESAHWKAVATGAAMLDLPPLPAGMPFQVDADAFLLSSAVAKSRIEKASMLLVDLTNKEKSPRMQLREMKEKRAAISNRLETIAVRCSGRV